MNKCHFLGKATSIQYFEPENSAAVIEFSLEVEEFRKEKSGKNVRELHSFDMEAWGSAAEALSCYLEEGGLLAVESIARNDGEHTFFRITSFKLLQSAI